MADFGCSKRLAEICTQSMEESLLAIRGSVPWMAPEVIKQVGYGTWSDIWSVGATVIEMATQKPPWPEFNNKMAALFHIATSTTPPTMPTTISDDCKEFILGCMQIDSSKRATAESLLKDFAFFKNYCISV